MSYDHNAHPNKLIGLDGKVASNYDSLKKWDYIAQELARELAEAKECIRQLKKQIEKLDAIASRDV